MSENKYQNLNPNLADLATTLTKGFAGLVPAIGPLMAELLGESIPQQRLDRVVAFLKQLEKRIANSEMERLKDNVYFVDLLENAVVQSTRSLTDERNSYLAKFMEINRDVDERDFSLKKKLLQALEELTDDDIETLESIHNPFKKNRFRRHERLTIGKFDALSEDEKYRYELLEASESAHINALEKNELIYAKRRVPDKRNEHELNDHLDDDTGLPEIIGREITSKGKLLLKSIGRFKSRTEMYTEACEYSPEQCEPPNHENATSSKTSRVTSVSQDRRET